jgi:4-carboxymuconolactone decarboxylase
MTEQAQRMLLPTRESMTDAQRAAADELTAGPRKGVKGPFIPLLRSPELMARMQKVGEYLRFESAVPKRLSEFATLVVSRSWAQQFEWFTHVPLATKLGTSRRTIDQLAHGLRPGEMSADEAFVYDLVIELQATKGLSQETYDSAVDMLGEQGFVELVALVGYFTTMSMILNAATIPAEPTADVPPLPSLPFGA